MPCSAKDMHQSSSPYPGLKVLQRNLGRGRGEAPRDDPCLPGVIVRTESIKKWLVKDNSCQEVPEATYCDFYEGDVYIVRWTYSLHAERSNLKGEVQSKQVGSDQVVYFFWQGSKCRTSEKGASALIVVELAASEGDPQVKSFVSWSLFCYVCVDACLYLVLQRTCHTTAICYQSLIHLCSEMRGLDFVLFPHSTFSWFLGLENVDCLWLCLHDEFQPGLHIKAIARLYDNPG